MSIFQGKFSMGYLILAALLATNAGLAYLAWDRWSAPIEMSPVSTAGVDVEKMDAKAKTGLVESLPPAGNLSQTTARPIFNASRRPIEIAKAPAAQNQPTAPEPPAVPPQQLAIVGILHLGDGEDKVLVRGSGDPPGSWIHVGESIEGWRITTIKDDFIVIENAGQQFELRMSYNVSAAGRQMAELAR